ncbi:DUF4238 domain-containing protein [Amycolatopsis sp. RTGN1]|uniref:DUF4238 domain-containing protein n=1 Tax=Amycolatopsis ponsaeliensis TaxID=2992142 RepID=UPI00254A917B|nr:DUF4238 domain-containing protein [Amycolatopsis sp. RTGN1]
MATWSFPKPVADYDTVIAELEAETGAPVTGQHVVSRVVLNGFAAPGKGSAGWELVPYDLLYGRELKKLGVRGCGKIANFLPFASASAERLWKSVEDNLGAAIKVARDGDLSSTSSHAQVIKDGIALHLVRSPRYLRIHQDSARESASVTYAEAPFSHADVLQAEFYRRHGFYAAGPDALRTLLKGSLERWEELQRSGKLARVSMAAMFERIRTGLREYDLEILRAPRGCDLIVSDAPAFTFRFDESAKFGVGCAVGDAHGIAMPIAGDCIAVIGPAYKTHGLSRDEVELFNRVQIERAIRFVWFRPGSGLGAFVAEAAKAIRPPRSTP